MEFIKSIINVYAQFFSADNLAATLSSSSNLMIILSLVIMEGLLSADNALVLAMMVKHLPQRKQKKALVYGIWGAYIFRFIAIGIGTQLIRIWWIKIIAAAYLLNMAIGFFLGNKEEGNSAKKAVKKGFWSTVLTVELMDVAFSIDSITAAFGISNQVWVLFLGAVLGILMMRGIAQIFVVLIQKIPELEYGAYILIAIIGMKMLTDLLIIQLPEYIFFGALILVFLSVLIVHTLRAAK
jgi:YkoY family integral membrane protein